MDSLSQIVLGASVGEIVLGKKAGNRAMLIGAFGGTIPDLDVIANVFMNEINATAFHRGITHSIFFALVMAPIFGYLAYRFYQAKIDQHKTWRAIMSILGGLAFSGLTTGALYFSFKASLVQGVIVGLAALGLAFVLYQYSLKYYQRAPSTHMEIISHKHWSLFFFWTIFTHPILDCFTTYGTQLFQPFSNYRVVWGTVSVVDPFYTLPFLALLIIAAFYRRENPRRKYFNYTAITVSCLFLCYSVFNKIKVGQIFKKTMAEQNISYDRFTTTPTIFNNFLWSATFESEEDYNFAFYSVFDSEKKASDLQHLKRNQALLEPYKDHRYIKILDWFTKGYWTAEQTGPNTYEFIDLRWGMMPKEMAAETGAFPMVFKIEVLENGDLEINSQIEDDINLNKVFPIFIDRIKGK